MKYALLLLLFLAACTTSPTVPTVEVTGDPVTETMNNPAGDDSFPAEEYVEVDQSAWMRTELTDVNTGETYTIDQFDQPVFVESFAVWCPTCTRQQIEFKKFHETNPEIVTIALDTDPNEDATKVKEHAQANGFTWRYSVSPAELTQGLIDEFGLGVVNAPAVPVVLVCPDGSAEMLGRGIKDQTDLAEALASCGA